MKQRIITAVILLILIVPCIVIGGIPFKAFMAFIAVMSTYELVHIAAPLKHNFYMYPLMLLFIGISLFTGNDYLMNSLYLAVFLLSLFTISIFDAHLTFDACCYYFACGALVAFGVHMIYVMRMLLGVKAVLLLAFATLGADTGAYFVGMKFGKHKLNPRLSPKKTIEGSIGGVVVGGLMALIFGLIARYPLPFHYLLLTSFILAATGQLGDLTFSHIKRHYNVKDYSAIFPGHGGVLDRFDSILFNAMVFAMLLTIMK